MRHGGAPILRQGAGAGGRAGVAGACVWGACAVSAAHRTTRALPTAAITRRMIPPLT